MFEDMSLAHERIDQWESALADRVARATDLANQLATLSVTARDRDGLVEVTVDSAGVPTDLWLSEAVRHQSAAEIARLVLGTMRAAQAQLADRVSGAATEAYGADSPAAAAIIARVSERLGGGDAAR